MIRPGLFWTSLVAILAASPGSAQSKAATYLIQQAISEGCESHRGTMDASGAIERDLDGDGAADLIIADDGLRCSGPSPRSINCGMQVCSVTFYLRRGPLLQKVHEMLGAGLSVGSGRIPKVHMYAHGGRRSFVRWNGSRFD
ncbi:hypothetical protein [Methylobacterium sp. SI9]|uniref:hypothetical protein n=1 Tax=Methylobacterium guangdongense TaxID=3138811 RepID=UPI00313F167A